MDWSLLTLLSESYQLVTLLRDDIICILMWFQHHRVSIWPRNLSAISLALLSQYESP